MSISNFFRQNNINVKFGAVEPQVIIPTILNDATLVSSLMPAIGRNPSQEVNIIQFANDFYTLAVAYPIFKQNALAFAYSGVILVYAANPSLDVRIQNLLEQFKNWIDILPVYTDNRLDFVLDVSIWFESLLKSYGDAPAQLEAFINAFNTFQTTSQTFKGIIVPVLTLVNPV